MWLWLSSWWTWVTDVVCNKLGYYTPGQCTEINLKMAYRLDELSSQNEGLVWSVGQLDQRHKDAIMIITALLALSGKEEETLKLKYIHELYNQGYTINSTNNSDEDIVLKLIVAGQTEEGEENGAS